MAPSSFRRSSPRTADLFCAHKVFLIAGWMIADPLNGFVAVRDGTNISRTDECDGIVGVRSAALPLVILGLPREV